MLIFSLRTVWTKICNPNTAIGQDCGLWTENIIIQILRLVLGANVAFTKCHYENYQISKTISTDLKHQYFVNISEILHLHWHGLLIFSEKKDVCCPSPLPSVPIAFHLCSRALTGEVCFLYSVLDVVKLHTCLLFSTRPRFRHTNYINIGGKSLQNKFSWGNFILSTFSGFRCCL